MPNVSYHDLAKLSDTHEMVMSLHSRLDAGDFAKAGLGAGALPEHSAPARNRTKGSAMKPIMQATFAVFLAVAMLADGNARAEEHEEFAEVGDNCVSSVSNDTFDGRTVSGACWDNSNDAFVGARCNNNRTDLILWIGEPLKPAEGGISIRTALDGVETDPWSWAMTSLEGEIFNTFKDKALYIFRQSRKIPTIKEMLKHSRLQVRIIDGWDNIHNVDIDISAFGEAIAPVRGACGW